MRKKRILTACLAVALLISGAAGGRLPVRAEEGVSRVMEVSAIEKRGRYIRNLTTDRSMYNPGDVIHAQAELASPDGGDWSGEVVLILRYLDRIVWQSTLQAKYAEGQLSFDVSAPATDFRGYSLEAYLCLDGVTADYAMTGVDVSSDWNVFPRYGYVTKMNASTGDVQETLERLKNHHINGLFYYDVFDSQEKPLAGSVEEPAESWNTLNRSLAKKQTLLDTINIGHEMNIKSFFYNLIFGAYDNYEEAGVSAEWGMYCDQRHQNQDVHDISGIGWETEKFWLMNPANTEWQDYYIQAHQDLFSVYPYDGIQVDSLGDRGDRYDYDGNPIRLADAYVPMLVRLTESLNKKVIFNPVSSYGLDTELKAVDYDIVYVEVWPGDAPDFASLKEKADEIYRSTEGRKGTVFGAYMNYDAPKSEDFNVPSINYINSVLMASGVAHLELGDTGMLSSEYYPGNSMRITSGLASDLLDEYSFQVAYENLLRGTGLTEVRDTTTVGGKRTSSDFRPGNVTSFAKVKVQEGEPQREVLHLLNFDGASHDSWVDKGLAQTAPTIKENLTVTHSCTIVPEKVWVASPDYQGGMMQEVEFTVTNGTVTFTLPYLEYYTMVVME